MPDYQHGKIYTLINDLNDVLYIGSTAQKYLSSRMGTHRKDALKPANTSPLYTAMRELGIDHFRMVLHHSFPCNSKDELIAEEYRTLDAIIVSGKKVYNAVIQGKPGPETKAKMAKASLGKKHTDEAKKKMSEAKFSYGCIYLQDKAGKYPRWTFMYCDKDGKLHKQSFTITKYGNFGAHFRAEEARRTKYPEWGNDEDIYCDDLGHIEWD